jgi:hypothetical protein
MHCQRLLEFRVLNQRHFGPDFAYAWNADLAAAGFLWPEGFPDLLRFSLPFLDEIERSSVGDGHQHRIVIGCGIIPINEQRRLRWRIHEPPQDFGGIKHVAVHEQAGLIPDERLGIPLHNSRYAWAECAKTAAYRRDL